MKSRIRQLRAEVKSDLATFQLRIHSLLQTSLEGVGPDSSTLDHVAVALHHAYGAVEAALLRTVRSLDGAEPTGTSWHQELLEIAALEIPGTRPAIISGATLRQLRHLLSFRHFFRHGYAVDFDPSRLEILRRTAVAVLPDIEADFLALDRLLGTIGI